MTEFVTAASIPEGTYDKATIRLDYSDAAVSVEVDGRTLPARSGVLEVGGDERAFDVPLQDFPD